jgi:hypothetical protein
MVSDFRRPQAPTDQPPVFGTLQHALYLHFFVLGGSLIGSVLNSGIKLLSMLKRTAPLAKQFQRGLLFLRFLQGFYDTKNWKPKLKQWTQLIQIMTFRLRISRTYY